MKKKKRHQQGVKVPVWMRFTFKNIERLSPYVAMRIAAYVFSKPIKFKPPIHEQKATKHCSKEFIHIPKIDKNVLTYTWKNSGESVLLAHGWSGRGAQLYSIAKTLHELGYHVVAYDAPAHGSSSGKLTNVFEMISTIEHLNGFEKFDHFIGHSLGGMALLNYCSNPEINAKKIVTIGAGDKMRMIFDNYIKTVGLKLTTGALMTSFFEKKFKINIADYSSSTVVRKLNTPTLIIHDEDDADIDVLCASSIVKQHPNALLLKTKGLGHRKILRDEYVLNQIKSFIEKS